MKSLVVTILVNGKTDTLRFPYGETGDFFGGERGSAYTVPSVEGGALVVATKGPYGEVLRCKAFSPNVWVSYDVVDEGGEP